MSQPVRIARAQLVGAPAGLLATHLPRPRGARSQWHRASASHFGSTPLRRRWQGQTTCAGGSFRRSVVAAAFGCARRPRVLEGTNACSQGAWICAASKKCLAGLGLSESWRRRMAANVATLVHGCSHSSLAATYCRSSCFNRTSASWSTRRLWK